MKKSLLFAAAVLMPAVFVHAEVKVASVFSDNAVLQREMKVPVWGKADPGEKVSVSFAGQNVSAVADSAGKWRVDLAPLKASAAPAVMTVTGRKNSVSVKNLLVGEVWLCSGQSNMEMPLWTADQYWRNVDGDKYAAEGANDLIRFTEAPKATGYLPNADAFQPKWTALSSENAKGISAVAFFFSRRLQKELGVPVGLVLSRWSGSRIEPWISPDGYRSVPELKEITYYVNSKIPGTAEYKAAYAKVHKDFQDYLKALEDAGENGKVLPNPPAFPDELRLAPWDPPCSFYNVMIYPFVPYAMRGSIWYQGCSNLGNGMSYKHKMQALYNGWQKAFENPDFSFYFVQLAPHDYGRPNDSDLPYMWTVQEAFALENPEHAAMAVINDYGDPGDIHPHHKEAVGQRLADLALHRDYGRADIQPYSPVFKYCKAEPGRLVVDFDHVKEFKVKEGVNAFEFMEVADLVSGFVPAKVQFDGSRMILTSDKVANPCKVRYMWKNRSDGRIFNESGLPLGAFFYEPKLSVEETLKEISGECRLLYTFDCTADKYTENHIAEFKKGGFTKIVYVVESQSRDHGSNTVIAGMDTFTDDPAKLAVPSKDNGIRFQQKVKNLFVISKSANIATGTFPEGNIELSGNNYATGNAANIPGASSGTYDFGDEFGNEGDYGCFQVHNFLKQETVFAYNHFHRGGNSDFGIGNAPNGNKDWTFAANLKNFIKVQISVYLAK